MTCTDVCDLFAPGCDVLYSTRAAVLGFAEPVVKSKRGLKEVGNSFEGYSFYLSNVRKKPVILLLSI